LFELRRTGLLCEAEKRITVLYEGVVVGDFVADIVVNGKVLIELKAIESVSKAHEVQTVNYLAAATGIDIGLVLNFGAPRMQLRRKLRHRRIVTGSEPS
jgi:GxxExxY protein